MKTSFTLFTFLLVLPFISSPLKAQINDNTLDQMRTNLEEVLLQDVVVLSTAVEEATEELPKHVRVRGYTLPANHFIFRFPVDDWNEKFIMYGCGAGCGELPVDISGNPREALSRGYSTVMINSGHWSPSIFQLDWAYNNPEAEKDFAHRAAHATVVAAKGLINAFYGREPTYSYFQGCSNGGRMGIMEAARYPDDFDGIIAESPGMNYKQSTLLFTWYRQNNTSSTGENIITPADLPLIAKAVSEACDDLDGEEDGLINSPDKCRFDPEVLLCRNENGKNCLSREKVEVLKKWYQGPVDSSGKRLVGTGVIPGTESFWAPWMIDPGNEPFKEWLNAENWLQNIAFREDPGASYSIHDFDFDKDPDRMDYLTMFNVDTLSLSSFKEAGGKLLIYHGYSDPAVPYVYSERYYDRNHEEFGPAVDTFLRLFLVPGMDHCAVLPTMGITSNSMDPLTVLENWVESDQPPVELPVTRFKADGSVDYKFTIAPYQINEN